MTDKYEDALKVMPHINESSKIGEWYYKYFYEIDEALKLASVAEDMEKDLFTVKVFFDVEKRQDITERIIEQALAKFKEIK